MLEEMDKDFDSGEPVVEEKKKIPRKVLCHFIIYNSLFFKFFCRRHGDMERKIWPA